MLEQTIQSMTKEDFYGQNDSAYIRIEYVEPLGYRIFILNELLLSSDAETKAGEFIQAIARGLMEMAYMAGEKVYMTGKQALVYDTMVASSEGMTEEMKEIWYGPTEGGIH